MSIFYILEGHEPMVVNLATWGKWFKTADRHIGKTDIGVPAWKFWLGKLLKIKKWEPVRISTVFLGLNHSFEDDGSPLLFETMVFGGKHDQDMERYSTWDEAERGHKKFIEMIKAN